MRHNLKSPHTDACACVCLFMHAPTCKLWISGCVLHSHLYCKCTDTDVLLFLQRDWFNCQITGLLPNWGRTSWTACKGKSFRSFLYSSILNLHKFGTSALLCGKAKPLSHMWSVLEVNQAVSQVALKRMLRLMRNNTDGLKQGVFDSLLP